MSYAFSYKGNRNVPGAPLTTSATITSRGGAGATISDDSAGLVAGVDSLLTPRVKRRPCPRGVPLTAKAVLAQRMNDMVG